MTLAHDITLVDARGRKYLTGPERSRFLEAVSRHPKPTVQTLASTLAHTGCRVSEALALRACDVDLEARELRLSTLISATQSGSDTGKKERIEDECARPYAAPAPAGSGPATVVPAETETGRAGPARPAVGSTAHASRNRFRSTPRYRMRRPIRWNRGALPCARRSASALGVPISRSSGSAVVYQRSSSNGDIGAPRGTD